MSDSNLTPAVRANRERTIAQLGEHFAHDHLEVEELERLIDLAQAATTQAELDALLAPLPALPQPTDPARRGAPLPTRHRTEQEFVVAIMGGAERKGRWSPARNVYVVAVMGGVALDLRDAVLPLGVTEVRVFALMGGVEILVPPDMVVESSGMGIMGGFDHAGNRRYPVDESVPVLHVTGVAIMGGVEIRERLPGESGRDARRRIRQERRELGRGRE